MFVKQSVKRGKTVKYTQVAPVEGDPYEWSFGVEADGEQVFPVKTVSFSFRAVDGRWELRDYAVECDTGNGPGTLAIAVPGLDADMPGWLADLAVQAAQEA